MIFAHPQQASQVESEHGSAHSSAISNVLSLRRENVYLFYIYSDLELHAINGNLHVLKEIAQLHNGIAFEKL